MEKYSETYKNLFRYKPAYVTLNWFVVWLEEPPMSGKNCCFSSFCYTGVRSKLCVQIDLNCPNTKHFVAASMAQWLCHSPCKPGITSSIPGFSSLSEVPSPYDVSCWWEVKPKSNKLCNIFHVLFQRHTTVHNRGCFNVQMHQVPMIVYRQ